MNFVVVSAASLAILVAGLRRHVPHRSPDRPLQRRRRHVGRRLRRVAVGRRDRRHRRPVPPAPAPGAGGGVGTATGLAHGRQVRGQGRGSRATTSCCAATSPPATCCARSSCAGGDGVVHLAATTAVGRARPDARAVCCPYCIAGVAVWAASACCSRPSAITSCASSRPTPPTRARSWTAACGRGPGTPTTLVIPRCGGGCG